MSRLPLEACGSFGCLRRATSGGPGCKSERFVALLAAGLECLRPSAATRSLLSAELLRNVYVQRIMVPYRLKDKFLHHHGFIAFGL